MADEIIDEIISKKAFDEVERMKRDLADLTDAFLKSGIAVDTLNKALADAKGLGGVTSSINQAKQGTSQYIGTAQQLVATQEKITQALSDEGKELAALKFQLQQINAENKNFAREMQANEGSLEKMRATLIRLNKQWDAMEGSLRGSAFGAELQKKIQMVDTELKKLEAGTGRFQRNVGNYSNATFQLSQSLRELPAFAYSAQTGILALSNNLPMLIDSFNQVKGEVGSAGKALAIFGRSIFSFTNLFTIALGLFTVFYREIMAYVSGVEAATEAEKELNASHKDLMNSQAKEVGHARSLLEVAMNTNETYRNRKKSFEELQNLYPALLGSMTAEKALNGELADSYITLVDIIEKTAKKRALLRLLDESLGSEVAAEAELKLWTSANNRQGQFYYARESSIERMKSNLVKAKTTTEGIRRELELLTDIDITTGLDKEKKQKAEKQAKEVDRVKELKQQYENERKLQETAFNRGEQSFIQYQLNLIQIDKKYTAIRVANRTKTEETSWIDLQNDIAKNSNESLKVATEMASRILDASFDEQKKQWKDNLTPEMVKQGKEIAEAFKASLPKEVVIRFKKDQMSFEDIMATLQMVQGMLEGMSTLNDLQFDIEMSRIETKANAIDRYYEDEINKVKLSGKTKKEQEEELIKIEAQRAAQNRAIEIDKANTARKAARRQKGIDMAQITLSTAAAIMGFLKNPGGYAGIALSIGAGITGAAQIAKAAATPLPEFAKGTDNSPEGFAVVGEKGVELVQEPGGKSWLTPAKDTVTYLKKGSKVIPNDKLMQMVHNSAMIELSGTSKPVTPSAYEQALIHQFENLTTEVQSLKEIMSKKTPKVEIHGNFDHYMYVRKNIQ